MANSLNQAMKSNPYQTPNQPSGEVSAPIPSSAMTLHIAAFGVIGFVSLVGAALITPADPISWGTATALIFVLSYVTYFMGFWLGRKR